MVDSKRQAKRATRAERRAAEEAALQAQAAQAAKERKQQTIIGIIVVAIVVALVAVIGVVIYRNVTKDSVSADAAYSKMQSVKTQPAKADDKGGFLLSKDGYGKKTADVPTVGIYMEPLCPGCASVNRQLDPTLVKMMNAGQLNLELHFLNFQDNKSSDNYSNRAFNGAIYIAEHDSDPNHLMNYLSNIYADGFQPGELSNYVSVKNSQLEEQAVKAGVSEDVAKAAFSGKNEYVEWLSASNDYTISRPELFSSSGSFSSPTLTINNNYWSLNNITLANTTMVDGFLKAVGLKSDQVGVEGKLPSIGADKKPIDITA
ncbi:thioredoxin domain-containing protein [Bifidobacterium felsineum]|uniref:Disulfide bond formation protein DsbA n=1 Tax=Bifidobacterium felsineum TaxID=2045440 RepID=A0A2M9HL54_9BIFI|nr:disulfide bond formation protein DsbA [Bifidobacterium felsineum]MBT1163022.1 disulfide bond formation protein DsbA [Bifidobacterium felsineum]PJM77538.1 disulfide bond formation protein DsbA [Bifidobacterium felsineum]